MIRTAVSGTPGFISIAVNDAATSAVFYERYLGAVRDPFDSAPTRSPSSAGRRSL